jgi:hypothetical protein
MKKLLLILLCLPLIGFGQIYAGPTGCISGNCENGAGIFVDDVGNMYIAEFIDGVMNGEVTINYANDEKYIGELKDRERYGKGVLIYPNGDKYEGEFRANKQHGYGTLMKSDNAIIKNGIWKNGKLISEILHPSELGFEPE